MSFENAAAYQDEQPETKDNDLADLKEEEQNLHEDVEKASLYSTKEADDYFNTQWYIIKKEPRSDPANNNHYERQIFVLKWGVPQKIADFLLDTTATNGQVPFNKIFEFRNKHQSEAQEWGNVEEINRISNVFKKYGYELKINDEHFSSFSILKNGRTITEFAVDTKNTTELLHDVAPLNVWLYNHYAFENAPQKK